MIIEMITTIAGPNLSVDAGKKANFPEKKAVELVEAGFARYCDESKVEDVKVDEIDVVKSKLDELGVRYHPNSKLETLQSKLDKATGD